MTRDEIIDMATKCQLIDKNTRVGIYFDALIAYAKLVAQHEREKNIKICQELAKDMTPVAEFAAKLCAKSIEEQA